MERYPLSSKQNLSAMFLAIIQTIVCFVGVLVGYLILSGNSAAAQKIAIDIVNSDWTIIPLCIFSIFLKERILRKMRKEEQENIKE